ncbi:MAG: succinylglutamate desuccinylase/aspartoacylase family protein [Myxococcota bacterium]
MDRIPRSPSPRAGPDLLKSGARWIAGAGVGVALGLAVHAASTRAAPLLDESDGVPSESTAFPRHHLSAPETEIPWMSLSVLGSEVQPGESRRLSLKVSESFGGTSVATPVTVVHGSAPGPTLCLTAGIHGDEIIGIEVVRRVVAQLEPDGVRGTVIGVPVVNPLGFRRSSRYLPDRRDLNRYFPGRETGSSASRIAYRFFEQVVRRCEVLVDFHSGSFHRSNLPQVRADLTDPALRGLASWFGAPVVLHNAGRRGTLRKAAHEAGIEAILYEAGEPMRFDEESVEQGVEGSLRLMRSLGMIDGPAPAVEDAIFFQGSRWIRTDEGGIFLGERQLGDLVMEGDHLGTVTDPFTNDRVEIVSPFAGRVIGRALDQVVIPGFALYHLGTRQYETLVDLDADVDADALERELDERPE